MMREQKLYYWKKDLFGDNTDDVEFALELSFVRDRSRPFSCIETLDFQIKY